MLLCIYLLCIRHVPLVVYWFSIRTTFTTIVSRMESTALGREQLVVIILIRISNCHYLACQLFMITRTREDMTLTRG